MPFVETKSLHVEYEEHGEGPDVFVFLHGNCASPRWWRPIAERLPRRCRAVVPALRGSGQTRGRTTSFSMAQLAADLHELAETLRLPPFHLVGHSLGGAVAMQFALDYADQVRTLVLAAPAPAAGLSALRRGDSRLARAVSLVDPDHEPSMAMLRGGIRAARLLGTHQAMMRQAVEEMLPPSIRCGLELRDVVQDALSITPEASVGYLQGLHRWNIEDRLRQLHAPTLIIAGARDAIVPVLALEETVRLLPRGELEVWPDTGHVPQLSAPDTFVERLLAFTAAHPGSAPARILAWVRRVLLVVAAFVRSWKRAPRALPGVAAQLTSGRSDDHLRGHE
jgi:pimeloyl-ACP methyl ester carboxylesterase